jgi:hypothetical protein
MREYKLRNRIVPQNAFFRHERLYADEPEMPVKNYGQRFVKNVAAWVESLDAKERKRGAHTEKQGHIYAFRTPLAPAYLKIGWSRISNVQNRLRAHRTSLPFIEIVYISPLYVDGQTLERTVHRILDRFSTRHEPYFVQYVENQETGELEKKPIADTGGKEWFKIPDSDELVRAVMKAERLLYRQRLDSLMAFHRMNDKKYRIDISKYVETGVPPAGFERLASVFSRTDEKHWHVRKKQLSAARSKKRKEDAAAAAAAAAAAPAAAN